MIPMPRNRSERVEVPMPNATSEQLSEQLGEQRRTVDFDTSDIQLQDLVRMVRDGEIFVAPAYQRKFRWDDIRCSQLIESLMLGIPVPNLFMATNPNFTWEVVDGMQRLSTMVKFLGEADLRARLDLNGPLRLQELKKLKHYNGLTFDELPSHIQRHIRTRTLRVVTLNDKSDKRVRFDLFERLNTGGVELSKQEIRDCVFQGQFADALDKLAGSPEFEKVVRVTKRQRLDGTLEECVLRFFAFLDEYRKFEHSVTEFLNGYMEKASKGFDYDRKVQEFSKVFGALSRAFPDGIRRPGGQRRTPLNLYEGVSVGAALALRQQPNLVVADLDEWMASDELRGYTTGATNDRAAVKGRIEFCRDRFLGKPYVPPAAG